MLLSHVMIKDKSVIKYVNESARLYHDAHPTLASEWLGYLCDPSVNFLFTQVFFFFRELVILC